MKWEHEHYNLSDPDIQKKRIYLQSGDMDGVALQIGYQPLQRCAQQSGYIYPMRNEPSLQENWHFEKMRFKQSVEVSKQVYEMMDGGKKVFQMKELTNFEIILNKSSIVLCSQRMNLRQCMIVTASTRQYSLQSVI